MLLIQNIYYICIMDAFPQVYINNSGVSHLYKQMK